MIPPAKAWALWSSKWLTGLSLLLLCILISLASF